MEISTQPKPQTLPKRGRPRVLSDSERKAHKALSEKASKEKKPWLYGPSDSSREAYTRYYYKNRSKVLLRAQLRRIKKLSDEELTATYQKVSSYSQALLNEISKRDRDKIGGKL